MITKKLADTQAARIVADQMGAQYAEYARRLRAKDPQTMTTAEVRVIFAWVASTFDTLALGCRGSVAMIDKMIDELSTPGG